MPNIKTGRFQPCNNCKKELWVFKYQFNQKYFFCSKKCSQKYMTKENHPAWKGGRWYDSNGYIVLYRKEGKSVYEHRKLMEEKLGRKLKRSEQIHHINGIKDDNRIENLALLENSMHQALHGIKWQGMWSKLYAGCIECKTDKKKHAGKGLCGTCYQRKFKRDKKNASQIRSGAL